MRAKRVLLMIFLFAMTFAIAGCQAKVETINRFTGNFPNGFIDANYEEQTKPLAGFESAQKIANYDYVGFSVYYGEYIMIGNENNKGDMQYGLYSLITEERVLPTSYDDIDLYRLAYLNENGEYTRDLIAYLINMDGQEAIFSITRDEYILSFDDYVYLDIDVNNDFYPNIEVITYQLDTSDELEVKTYQVYYDKNEKRKDKLIVDEPKIGDVVTFSLYPRFPLLKDYTFNDDTDNVLKGFKNGKKKFDVRLPNFDNITSQFIINKFMYYQVELELPNESDNYTYYRDGKKYLLNTYRLNLTNGYVRNIKNFEYLLEDFTILMNDKRGNQNYLIAPALYISNRVLVEPNMILFNHNLTPVKNLTDLNIFNGYEKIGKNKYLMGDQVVDNKLNTLLDLSNYSMIRYLPNEDLISLRDMSTGRHGLIDLEGNIIAKFKYLNRFEFFNGYSYNEKEDDEFVFVDIEGVEKKVKEDYIVLPNLKLMFEDKLDSNGRYVYRTYSDEILFRSSTRLNNGTNIQNVYSDDEFLGRYLIFFDADEGKNVAYFLKAE